MIQIIGNVNIRKDLNHDFFICSHFSNVQSLDDYTCNIFDFTTELTWEENEQKKLSESKLFKDLIIMINKSSKAHNIIIFPKSHIHIDSKQSNTNNFTKPKKRLKINLREGVPSLVSGINSYINQDSMIPNLYYEKTKTNISKRTYHADFYFNSYTSYEKDIQSTSGKYIYLEKNHLSITTLDITSTSEKLIDFLKHLGFILEEKEAKPSWIDKLSFFNQKYLIERKAELNQKISNLKKDINSIDKNLDKIDSIKSILYTNGKELEKQVFDILTDIFGSKLSHLEENYDEDFRIKNSEDSKIILGEIKGVNTNVKRDHISQLDVHIQKYLDKNIISEDRLKGLLIINHQRKTNPSNRQEISNPQINLAKRNNSLILDTVTLLKIYEDFKKQDVKTEEILKMLTNNNGFLEYKRAKMIKQ